MGEESSGALLTVIPAEQHTCCNDYKDNLHKCTAHKIDNMIASYTDRWMALLVVQ